MDPDKDLTISNVSIWQSAVNRDPENYIHEIHVHPVRQGMPKLVIIHGYCLGGAAYYRMIQYLKDYYEVYTIDLLG